MTFAVLCSQTKTTPPGAKPTEMLYSSIVGLMSSDLEGVYTFSAKS